MPSQSRAQRRRQATRQQQQQQQRRPSSPAPSAEALRETVSTGPTIALDTQAPAAPRPAARGTRRVLSRPTPEPVDYTKDYQAVGRDLRWIALWTVLLFVAMIALKFSGLV
jgi:hypothetical protein